MKRASTANNTGTLYIVALPIGNETDITARALEILQRVDVIASEDTRVIRQLLKKQNLHKTLISYYDQIEAQRTPEIIGLLEQGQDVALTSDAGTPLISDPGYKLVNRARQSGMKVVPVPGACAVVAALSASGIPSDEFSFIGFLPRKEKELTDTLCSLAERKGAIVFYESPQRIKATLQLIHSVLGERHLCLAREITKPYEEFIYGTAPEVLAQLAPSVKGEITCVLEGAKDEQHTDGKVVGLARAMCDKGLSRKDTVGLLTEYLGVPRNELKRALNG